MLSNNEQNITVEVKRRFRSSLSWRADVMFSCSVWNTSSSSPVLTQFSFPSACQFSPSLFPFVSLTVFSVYMFHCILLHELIGNTKQTQLSPVLNLVEKKPNNMLYRKNKAVFEHSRSSCKNTNRCSEANGLPVNVYESGLFSGRSAAKHGWSSAWLHQLRNKKLKATGSDMTLY